MEDSSEFYSIPFHHDAVLGQARSIPNESEQMAGSYWLSIHKTCPTTGICPKTLIQDIALFLTLDCNSVISDNSITPRGLYYEKYSCSQSLCGRWWRSGRFQLDWEEAGILRCSSGFTRVGLELRRRLL